MTSKAPVFCVTPSDETPARFVCCVDEPKTRENETNLSPSEMKRFAAQVLTR
jgi:hypothetical protein